MEILGNYAFLTVGTTLFDALIEVADSEEFEALLQDLGYDGLLMQIGAATYKPKRAVEMTESVRSELAKKSKKAGKKPASFKSYYYNFKSSIESDIQGASLVISHAGSGSIIETLRSKLPIVVVVNDKLMHNHQEELAQKLDDAKYVLMTVPSRLTYTLKDSLEYYLRHRAILEPVDFRDFGELLKTKTTQRNANKTMVVLGSGGHTAEMFCLLQSVDLDIFSPRTYVMASTDSRSQDKITEFESQVKKPNPKKPKFRVQRIKRSRHVGQSYFTSIFTTILSFLYCIKMVFQEAPDLLICNGPGTCIPIIIAVTLFRWMFLLHTKIVYVESVARVLDLSLSGKIAQRCSDWFIIQWPELHPKVTKCNDVWTKNFFFPLKQ